MADGRALEIRPDSEGTIVFRLAGPWELGEGLPSSPEWEDALTAHAQTRRIAFDTRELTGWDSCLVTFLLQVVRRGRERGLEVDRSGLPEGASRLLDLAEAVPVRGRPEEETEDGVLERVGESALETGYEAAAMVRFLGASTSVFFRFLAGRARFRQVDLLTALQDCGAEALPIVSLISFLVGAILAFVGAVQLEQFGAQIYVANLVAVSVTREMGALMTGIIMAGRTGAAFAAQLGTMTVNEEVDALRTMGISPIDFLVLPRMLALMLMMPVLTIYADLVGIAGGAAVGVAALDLPALQYLEQTRVAIGLDGIAAGLIKGSVFGVLIAVAGCFHGIRSGRSASAVGEATTRAVVMSIVLIIVADAVLTVVYDATGF